MLDALCVLVGQEKHGVRTLMYVTPWFLCIFTNVCCWDTVLAIWHQLMLFGNTAFSS